MNLTPLPPPEAVGAILIWHQGALGDLLLAGSALLAVRRRYPRARIIGLGQPERWGLLSRTLSLDAVWDSSEARWAQLFADGPLPPELRACLAQFQLALVFSPRVETPAPGRLQQAGIPAVYWVPSFPEGGQEAVGAGQARQLAGLGLPLATTSFRLTLPEPLATKALSSGSPGLPAGAAQAKHSCPILGTPENASRMKGGSRTAPTRTFQAKACGYKDNPGHTNPPEKDFAALSGPGGWLAVAPGSGQALKNWPLSHYYEVSRALAWEYKMGVVWLAGPAEAAGVPYLEALAAAQGHGLLAGAPLARVAAVLARCRLFLGNDSGLTHLAAALGGPAVLALFGPTDPRVWAPPGERVQVLTGPCPKAPCAQGREIPCCKAQCLAELTPERVLGVARTVLSASLASG